MTTATDVITASYQELGVYATNETLESQDAQLGLDLLNRFISAWRDEYLYPLQIVNSVVNLTANKATYTVGQGQDIAIFRPEGMVYGVGVIATNNPLLNCDSVSALEWNMIYATAAATASGTPAVFFFDTSFYPAAILNVSQAPNVGGVTATLPFLYPFPSFADLVTNYTFASGVRDCFIHNLSVYAKPYFATANLDPNIAALAVSTKNYLRYSNRASRALLNRDIGRPVPSRGTTPAPPVAT